MQLTLAKIKTYKWFESEHAECIFAGATEDVGRHLLDACGGNLEMAIGMHMDSPAGASASPGGATASPGGSTLAQDQALIEFDLTLIRC